MQVLGVSETWLTTAVADSFVALSNYRIERKDNPSLIEKHGVSVYIRSKLGYVKDIKETSYFTLQRFGHL